MTETQPKKNWKKILQKALGLHWAVKKMKIQKHNKVIISGYFAAYQLHLEVLLLELISRVSFHSDSKTCT